MSQWAKAVRLPFSVGNGTGVMTEVSQKKGQTEEELEGLGAGDTAVESVAGELLRGGDIKLRREGQTEPGEQKGEWFSSPFEWRTWTLDHVQTYFPVSFLEPSRTHISLPG